VVLPSVSVGRKFKMGPPLNKLEKGLLRESVGKPSDLDMSELVSREVRGLPLINIGILSTSENKPRPVSFSDALTNLELGMTVPHWFVGSKHPFRWSHLLNRAAS
jgi:hypothetical protein